MAKVRSLLKTVQEFSPAVGVKVVLQPSKKKQKGKEFLNEIGDADLKLLKKPVKKVVDGKKVDTPSIFSVLLKNGDIQVISDEEVEETEDPGFDQADVEAAISKAIEAYKTGVGKELVESEVENALNAYKVGVGAELVKSEVESAGLKLLEDFEAEKIELAKKSDPEVKSGKAKK